MINSNSKININFRMVAKSMPSVPSVTTSKKSLALPTTMRRDSWSKLLPKKRLSSMFTVSINIFGHSPAVFY